MTKFSKNDFKPLLGTHYRFMAGSASTGSWTRPGPVFEAEGHNEGGNADTVKAAEALVASEAAKKTAEDNAAKLLKEVMGLKAKLKEKDGEFAKFEGIDPDAVKTMLAERAEQETKNREAEEKRLRDAGDFDKLRKQMADEHERAMKAEREARAAESEKSAKLQRSIEELTVGTAFANSSFLRDDTLLTPAKARKVYGDHFETENGVIKAYDKERGYEDRKPLVDASGNPLSFEDAMRRIIDSDPEKDRLLKSGSKQGSGQLPANKGGGKSDEGKNPTPGVNRIIAGLASLKHDT